MKIFKKGFLLLGVAMLGLSGCGENYVKNATEIKEIIATYESNIGNADFSKFTLIDNFKNHQDIDSYSFNSDEEKNLVVSYDEAGYLYYKNDESYTTSKGLNEYKYYETWLYIEENTLIWATISKSHEKAESKYYDVLECDSLDETLSAFKEYSFEILNDLFPNPYDKQSVSEIPTKYNLDYFEDISRICDIQISADDYRISIASQSDTLLELSTKGDDKYIFENGIFKSYNSVSTSSRKGNVNGNEVDISYKTEYEVSLSLSTDLNKPDLTKFSKTY